MQEVRQLCDAWLGKQWYDRTQLESLIGKLQFVAACVRPGRVFISRLLNILREMPQGSVRTVSDQIRADVRWWLKFLPTFNGVAVTWMDQMLHQDSVISSDASMTGIGGYLVDSQYFHLRVPTVWREVNIAYLEAWGDSVSTKLGGQVSREARLHEVRQ